MRLPTSVLIGIMLAVIALVVLVAFFVTIGGGAAGRSDMQRQFTEGCLIVCSMEQRTDMRAVGTAFTALPNWQNACEQLYGVERGAYMQCLDRCSCGALPTLCERLQRAANDVGADCPFLCTAALEHNATRLLYKGCDCECT